MHASLYQKECSRTFPSTDKRNMLNHAVFGLSSEAGEVSGIMQKVYQGHAIDPIHLQKELGDCLWFIAEACSAIDVNMDEIMKMNILKLRKRYPNGFEAEKSLNRAQGDI